MLALRLIPSNKAFVIGAYARCEKGGTRSEESISRCCENASPLAVSWKFVRVSVVLAVVYSYVDIELFAVVRLNAYIYM